MKINRRNLYVILFSIMLTVPINCHAMSKASQMEKEPVAKVTKKSPNCKKLYDKWNNAATNSDVFGALKAKDKYIGCELDKIKRRREKTTSGNSNDARP